MEQMLADKGGAVGKEKINMELGRKRALKTDVYFAANLVLARTVSSHYVLHKVQMTFMYLAKPSFHHLSMCELCLVPRAA